MGDDRAHAVEAAADDGGFVFDDQAAADGLAGGCHARFFRVVLRFGAGFLVPLGFVPYLLHMTGIKSAIITVMAGVLFLCQTFYLMMRPTDKAAKWMMFGSFFYLLIMQIALLFDQIKS